MSDDKNTAHPAYPMPPYPAQTQPAPGSFLKMDPRPDHGETTYKGSGRLTGKRAFITGGDSGIGRAVAIAFAREGADVAIGYLNDAEDADAKDTLRMIEAAGQRGLLIPGDIADADFCRSAIARVVEAFGGIDILVNNAAHQSEFSEIEDYADAEWEKTFAVNIHAMFYLVKAAVPHMQAGASIINSTSVNADQPSPAMVAYAATKGAIQNFTGGLAHLLAKRAIRVNCVAPGPVWTPLQPASKSAEDVAQFGANSPMGRPGQPAELASAYVMLADPISSYTSGATIAVTGGRPMI
ncbi:SDR family oxidoreductase [Ketogulonicigenium vulgare]|uniref:Short-chain dehydrogenase/reductase SDR n=1 Tax=Ketogulonicigenium vulgare (strain WSH-001) TaxID=759362 RepID=F9YAX8_KETVW|nr:SDR family oxidoreductase [Ketogulonicigenium vulgare]ADO44004.1 short-chain dehydrogenase/reductase SDR [Ketogulonicigenium vulgare Y25]AEM42530.1 Short-chain dehydrogenase/reductase SDR [Ketogulonicigenium vulgare WSH-001]ALJ82565.1 NAD(P)-dependent oxidoreductase [Ketogulonicigenium vulgare]ANW35332.1 NAD(P)-dependent oxidoreductase [Ketogulonicigenium vulgare]AOZ53234.1 short-chain dehydrogenase/reductase SDR [Ketogulonicigenium vulgare]